MLIISMGLTLFTLFYLVYRLDLGALSIFKIFIFIQIFGDRIFSEFWVNAKTYYFVKTITESDRLIGTLILLVSIIATNIGYKIAMVLIGRKDQITINQIKSEPQIIKNYVSIILCGILFKSFALLAMGFPNKSLATLRPEDSLSVSFLITVADFFIPFGLALRTKYKNRKNRFPIIDICLLGALSILSFSKGAFLNYLLVYVITYWLLYGTQNTKKAFINIGLIVLILISIVNVGIMTQARYSDNINYSREAIIENAINGSSGRLMGGTFRSYLALIHNIRQDSLELMNGKYHEQIFYLWIPRYLWPEKPRIATEQLYYYLYVTEESYGTSFAVMEYGNIIVDFGFIYLLPCSMLLGILLFLGDRYFPTTLELSKPSKMSVSKNFFCIAWITSAMQLAEGGITTMLTRIIILTGFYITLRLINEFINTLIPIKIITGNSGLYK